jgi:hypothetical protein
MRALEAGSIAAGAARCNQGSVRQTTSMAVLTGRARQRQGTVAQPVGAG